MVRVTANEAENWCESNPGRQHPQASTLPLHRQRGPNMSFSYFTKFVSSCSNINSRLNCIFLQDGTRYLLNFVLISSISNFPRSKVSKWDSNFFLLMALFFPKGILTDAQNSVLGAFFNSPSTVQNLFQQFWAELHVLLHSRCCHE